MVGPARWSAEGSRTAEGPRCDSSAGTPRETERVADEPRPRRARGPPSRKRASSGEGGAFGLSSLMLDARAPLRSTAVFADLKARERHQAAAARPHSSAAAAATSDRPRRRRLGDAHGSSPSTPPNGASAAAGRRRVEDAETRRPACRKVRVVSSRRRSPRCRSRRSRSTTRRERRAAARDARRARRAAAPAAARRKTPPSGGRATLRFRLRIVAREDALRVRRRHQVESRRDWDRQNRQWSSTSRS